MIRITGELAYAGATRGASRKGSKQGCDGEYRTVVRYRSKHSDLSNIGNSDPTRPPDHWTNFISEEPLFVSPSDYHLLPNSPCIDAGINVEVYTDIESNIRPFDYIGVDNNGSLPEFDMGAYEIVPEPTTLFLLGLGGLAVRKRKQ